MYILLMYNTLNIASTYKIHFCLPYLKEKALPSTDTHRSQRHVLPTPLLRSHRYRHGPIPQGGAVNQGELI